MVVNGEKLEENENIQISEGLYRITDKTFVLLSFNSSFNSINKHKIAKFIIIQFYETIMFIKSF